MGTLSETDKSYLAQNFLAFFRRDYHRVATAHIESGWVPPDTRVDELEAEIRVVLRADLRPAAEGDLARQGAGVALPRVAPLPRAGAAAADAPAEDAARTWKASGRQLDPDLDLWVTAKPFLERWMKDQIGCPRCSAGCSPRPPTSWRRCPSCRVCIHRRLLEPPAASDAATRRARRGAAHAQSAGWA